MPRFLVFALFLFQVRENFSLSALFVERVKWITTGNQAVARRGRTIAESTANALPTEWSPGQGVGWHFRIGQHHASQPDEIGLAGPHRGLPHMGQPLLQVGI